jgi:hypothetical protein
MSIEPTLMVPTSMKGNTKDDGKVTATVREIARLHIRAESVVEFFI